MEKMRLVTKNRWRRATIGLSGDVGPSWRGAASRLLQRGRGRMKGAGYPTRAEAVKKLSAKPERGASVWLDPGVGRSRHCAVVKEQNHAPASCAVAVVGSGVASSI